MLIPTVNTSQNNAMTDVDSNLDDRFSVVSDGAAWSTDLINNSDSDLESNSPSKYTPYSTYSSVCSGNNHPSINELTTNNNNRTNVNMTSNNGTNNTTTTTTNNNNTVTSSVSSSSLLNMVKNNNGSFSVSYSANNNTAANSSDFNVIKNFS